MKENIIDEKSIRDKLSSRIDVLKKVKNVLAYIPATTGSTIQQVADFYNEPSKTELMYKHHINLWSRGDSPYISHIEENEWQCVNNTFAAMCRKYGTTVTEMIKDMVKIA